MRRLKLKKNRKKFKSILIIILVFLFIYIFLSFFKDLDKKALNTMKKYAETEVKRISINIMNSAINKEVTDINLDNLFLTTTDEKGNTKNVEFNSVKINKLLTNISNDIEYNLKKLEKGELNLDSNVSNQKRKKGVIYEIPLTVIFENNIFYKLGPKIPVRLSFVGNVQTKVNTKVTNYGLNNALVQIILTVEVNEVVMIPFVKNEVVVKNDFILAMKLLSGEIPGYYYNGLSSESFNR